VQGERRERERERGREREREGEREERELYLLDSKFHIGIFKICFTRTWCLFTRE
jgi:hypothetical protein